MWVPHTVSLEAQHSSRTVRARSTHLYYAHPGATNIYSHLPRMPQSITGLTSHVRARLLVSRVHELSARQHLLLATPVVYALAQIILARVL